MVHSRGNDFPASSIIDEDEEYSCPKIYINEDYCSTYIYQQLLIKSKLPSLEIRRIRMIAIEVYKIINKQCPLYLLELIEIKKCNYSFRNNNIADVPRMAAPPSGQYPSMISQTSVPPFSSSGMTQQTSTHQPPQQIVSPTREINAINLCKKGQECVQDVVQKAGEIFKLLQLKSLPLPNGVTMNAQMHQEKRGKLEEGIQQLQQNFMKLRLMYDKANEITGPDEPPEE
ncbi:Hypothetical predicted protein, partial [Mytilus galloprovincialis]